MPFLHRFLLPSSLPQIFLSSLPPPFLFSLSFFLPSVHYSCSVPFSYPFLPQYHLSYPPSLFSINTSLSPFLSSLLRSSVRTNVVKNSEGSFVNLLILAKEYVLEKQSEPGVPISLDATLESMGTKEFCLVRFGRKCSAL